MHHRWTVAALVCAVASSGAVAQQINLTSNFDNGSLASWHGDLNNIRLAGRDNYNTGEWRWMYFEASGVLGAQPTFTIIQNFAGDNTPGPHELRDHEMVYSYDNEHWFFFDNNQYQASYLDTFQFSNSTPFTQNTVYIAYAIPYTYGRSVSHTQTVLASPWAAPTVSGNSSGVIGQTAPGVDDMGRSVPALNLYAYHITDPSVPAGEKKKVGLSAGLHAGEPLGNYTLEGLVNWLISDDPRAAALRQKVDFFVYPMLNPSGRYDGMNRTTLASPNQDPNGFWNENTWNTNAKRDIRISGEAMKEDVFAFSDAGLDAFIDFHSTVPDYDNPTGLPNDFGFVNPEDSDTDWWLEVQRLNNGNLIEYTSGSGDYTTTGYARRVLGAEVEITVETQFTWERNTDYYHDLGESFGVAFYNSWVVTPEPGSMMLVSVGCAALFRRRRL